MNSSDIPFRNGDSVNFEKVRFALTEKGRIEALTHHKFVTHAELVKLDQLRELAKGDIKYKRDYENLRNDLKKMLPNKLEGKHEIYYLLYYGYEIIKRTGGESGRGNLNSALISNGLSYEKNACEESGIEWLQKQPSNKTLGRKSFEKLFLAFQEAQNPKINCHLACFLDFLEFCDDQEYPLAAFNYDGEKLKETIADIKTYLFEKEEKEEKEIIRINFKEESIYTFDNEVGAQSLSIPNNKGCQSLNNVASLLDWKYHLTSFIGRKRELKQLREWITSGKDKSIQLIYGEGGAGKTRLAFQFAALISGREWLAGETHKAIEGDWYIGETGMLLVIDHPEERRDSVEKLLRSLERSNLDGKKVYILVVSRNRGFLDVLIKSAPGLHTNTPIYLSGLNDAEEEWSLMESAWYRLNKLEILSSQEESKIEDIFLPIKKIELITWLKRQNLIDMGLNSTPLMIIALSLYLFKKKNRNEIQLSQLRFPKIIRSLSEYEEDRITQEIEKAKKAKYISSDVMSEGVLLIKAMATITDGMDDKIVRNLIEDLKRYDIDYLPPEAKYLKSKNLSLWENAQLPALTPDILAADFLFYCLKNYAQNQEAEWIFSVMGLNKTSRQTDKQISNNFTRLDRLIFDSKAKLTQSWPINALCSAIQKERHHSEWISHHLAKDNGFSPLLPLIVQSLRASLTYPQPPVMEAYCLMNLSQRCGNKKNENEEAIELGRRAIAIYKLLSKQDYNLIGGELAKTRSNLSNRLVKIGNIDEALLESKQAINIFKDLVNSGNMSHLPDAGRVLIAHSALLFKAGKLDQALLASREAVNIFQSIGNNYSGFETDLAKTLINHSIYLVKTGDFADGIHKELLAIKIIETLSRDNYNSHVPCLAQCLHNLSIHLMEASDADINKVIHQAAKIYQDIATNNCIASSPVLTQCLGCLLGQLGNVRLNSALCAVQYATSIYKDLIQLEYNKYAPNLGQCLSTLASLLSKTDNQAAAVNTYQQLIDLYRILSKENGPVYALKLARRLTDLSILIFSLDQSDDRTYFYSKEAMTILNGLCDKDRASYVSDLARSLYVFAASSHFLDTQTAETHIKRAVNLNRELAKDNPDVFMPLLAKSFFLLALRYFEIEKRKLAYFSVQQMRYTYAYLIDQNFEEHAPELARVLDILANLCSELELIKDGKRINRQLIEVNKKLSEKNWTTYSSALGESLLNYCVKFELHAPFLERAKSIYLQIRSTNSDEWVQNFPNALSSLQSLSRGKNSLSGELKFIKAMMQEIEVPQ